MITSWWIFRFNVLGNIFLVAPVMVSFPLSTWSFAFYSSSWTTHSFIKTKATSCGSQQRPPISLLQTRIRQCSHTVLRSTSSHDNTKSARAVDPEEERTADSKSGSGGRGGEKVKNISKASKTELKSIPARILDDNGLVITNDEEGRIIAVPTGNSDGPPQKKDKKSSMLANDNSKQTSTASMQKTQNKRSAAKATKADTNTVSTSTIRENNNSGKKPNTKFLKEEIPKPIDSGGFNVVLTHCTADFDSLASAVGLAKLWSNHHPNANVEKESTEFQSSQKLPTFVVLPRGAHPSVNKFLALHKHLFPIRSLRSLPSDLSGLNRLGLVDAQKRERVGPAEHLLSYANRVTIVDHHIEGDSDITEATDYVVDKVGSVSAMIAEQLRDAGFELTEAEATLLALGIHADTGSLCYDSTTVRDVEALAWVMSQGASQAAIAEHAHSTLSQEQQGVLTNALINTNSTLIHGVTVSTALLSADGFINGLAAVTQDALELSSSDVYILAVVYEAKSGKRGKGSGSDNSTKVHLSSKLMLDKGESQITTFDPIVYAEAWKGGERALRLKRLRAAFDNKDSDGSGYLEVGEIASALSQSGVITSEESLALLLEIMDTNGDGKVDFDEFVAFSEKAEEMQKEHEKRTGRKATTMIVIGRVKAGVNMKNVNLNHLFEPYGGGGHAKAASCTIKIDDESHAGEKLQTLVDELIQTGLTHQQTVGDFMTSPVLSAKPTMNEKQVEDLFVRYDVRALPVVDENNNVIGLVTYKEVAAAKQRLWNKEQKRIRQEAEAAAAEKAGKKPKMVDDNEDNADDKKNNRKLGSALKGWMKQHVQTVEASMTMAEVEAILLETDVGCIPVVADGTKQLVGMVTRTDLLRQHRYYPSLHYHNPGFSDSIAARKPIVELRKKLKKFDLDD
mmetsp:Transcript_247/g.396  ORF Transcript_247/g.396 Transcript_247/m.396 type:complete len:907 (-) Transcript_247:110-2830(-)